MLIPLIPKDSEASDFTCRDGEVEFLIANLSNCQDGKLTSGKIYNLPGISLTPEGTFPTANIRVPVKAGEDPTQAIIQEAAQTLLDLSTDYRRQGLFLLPFRVYTMTQTHDGSLSYPSPQAVALPTDFPPHPEIIASSTADDAITLALRFPVRPHRLVVSPSTNLPSGHSLRTFISYPLYIPDPKEIRGSLGSVRSAVGGNVEGIRFKFLSTSAVKASVAAPEKYYELVGNARTGYRFSSKAAAALDYSCYAKEFGHVSPFPRESLLALGADVAADTDPMDWIADWQKAGEGYLPTTLPYIYRRESGSQEDSEWPEGIDRDEVMAMAEELGMSGVLLTRPMAFAADSRSRRNAEARAIRWLHVQGLGDEPALAILYGSTDCRRWTAMRRFDPRRPALLLTPPRPWWRLLLYGTRASQPAIWVDVD